MKHPILSYALVDDKIKYFLAYNLGDVVVSSLDSENKVYLEFIQYATELDLRNITSKLLDTFLKEELSTIIVRNGIYPEGIITYEDNPSAVLSATETFKTQLSALHTVYTKAAAQIKYTGPDLYRAFFEDYEEYINELGYTSIQKLITQIGSMNYSKAKKPNEIADEAQMLLHKTASLDSRDLLKKAQTFFDLHSNKGKLIKRKVGSTGIVTLEDSYAVYSSEVTAHTGGPGVGKTRFQAQMIVHSATVLKSNVLWDTKEVSDEFQAEAYLVTRHIFSLYNGEYQIDPAKVTRGELSPEQQNIYDLAREDLFNNPDYGRIHINIDPLHLEDIRTTRYSFLKVNKIDLWCIDYMGLIERKDTRRYMAAHDVITEAYKELYLLLKYALPNIGVAVINQLNNEGSSKAINGQIVFSGGEEQGGMSIARYITTNLILVETPEQMLVNSMLAVISKSRNGAKKNVPLKALKMMSVYTASLEEGRG